uniref:Uroplakin 3B n=1 Tax=Aquila chrysaetos chrysaetos TaxID=223781 RepID=A0A663E1T8_AQUCH
PRPHAEPPVLLQPDGATGPGLPHKPKPSMASSTLGGLTTSSTFTLEQPRCIFTDLQDDVVIWLVVAVPEGRWDAARPRGEHALAYMTLNTTLLNYPCPKPPGEIAVLRVGSETSCAEDNTRPTCNGPLPGPGPYQVKFLALMDSDPVAETAWSDPITLRTGTAAGVLVPPVASSRSRLAGSFSKPEAVTVRRYNTHHVYDQPAARL